MSFNLNNGLDFAKATFSDTSSLLNNLLQLGGGGTWDIQEGSFNGVKFMMFESQQYGASVSQIQDAGGRRKAKYLYPYVDGQTTDDLGRKPDQFSINIIFHGNNYLGGYKRLFSELNKPQPGTLVHPVRGAVQCVMEDYTITHQSDQRKAMVVTLVMIEHNFSSPSISALNIDASFKGIISKAVEFFNNLQNVITKIQGTIRFVQNIRAKILSQLNSIKNRYATLLMRLNKTFNGRPIGNIRSVRNLDFLSSSTISRRVPSVNSGAEATVSYNDIPLILPVNEGGLLNPDGTFVSTVPRTSISQSDPLMNNPRRSFSPSDPFANIPLELFNETTNLSFTVDDLQKQVNDLRQEIDVVIKMMSTSPLDIILLPNGQVDFRPIARPNIEGALEFNQEIIDLKAIAIILQEVFERGKASSRAIVVEYITPRLMTIREVCFANNISVNRAVEVELLNPELTSVNYIEQGTLLKVPV